MKRKRKGSSPGPAKKAARTNANTDTKTDEFGDYIKKDVYETKVSVETESERFKVAERIGKMRARHSDSICASDHEMKRHWNSGWKTGYIKTIGIRRSTGPPAPRRRLATFQPGNGGGSE